MSKKSNNKFIYTLLIGQLFIINSVCATSTVDVPTGITTTFDHIMQEDSKTMDKIGAGELVITNAAQGTGITTFLVKISAGTVTTNNANALGNKIELAGGSWKLPTIAAANMSSKTLAVSSNSTVDVRTTGHRLPQISGSNATLALIHTGDSAADVTLSAINGLTGLSVGQTGQQQILTTSGSLVGVTNLSLKTGGKAKIESGQYCTGAISFDGGELNTISASTIPNSINVTTNDGSIKANDDLSIIGIMNLVEGGELKISAPLKKVTINQSPSSNMHGSLNISEGELEIASGVGFNNTSSKVSISSGAKASFSDDVQLNELSFS